jgi:putative phage-type endonuclease
VGNESEMTAAILLGHYEPGSQPWHDVRRSRLGASEIAAVMGLSPWQSPFSLWCEKSGSIAPQFETEEMSWGKDMEEVIARWFAREHPERTVHPCGLWLNIERPYQVAQPDRLINHVDSADIALLEIKTARQDEYWGKPGTDDIPVYYRAQCLWQLDTFKLKTCHIAVSIAGSPPVEYVVTYSADEVALMRAAAVDFLASIERDEPPDIDGHIATYRAVRELHPLIDGSKVQVDEELAGQYLAALEGYDDAVTAKQEAAARIVAVMGDARYAMLGDRKIAMRVPNRDHAPYLKVCKQRVSE